MAATFLPRKTEPNWSDRWWNTLSAGGVNRCININNGCVVPNCVGYAWGRFSEILGEPSTLPISNAGEWWERNNTYASGQTPKLGSVIVWGKPGDAGHVAIVEEIYDDGSILTSNSAYGGTKFYMQTLYPPKYTWSSSYYLKGFIYNPAVSGDVVISTSSSIDNARLMNDFISLCVSKVGTDRSWTTSKIHVPSGQAWSAAFICAVAKEVGDILGSLIYNSTSGSSMISGSIKNGYGVFTDGPYSGHNVTPRPGDIVAFRWANKLDYASSSIYYCDHVGVVVEVKDNKIVVVSGDSTYGGKSHMCGKTEYDTTYRCIFGYYRPNWENNDIESQVVFNDVVTPIDSSDAMIREVGYLSRSGINLAGNGVRLSAINYTGAFSKTVPYISSKALSIGVDSSKITNTVARNLFDILYKKGIDFSIVIALLGNIQSASSFRTDFRSPTNPVMYGLCNWSDFRFRQLETVCKDWRTNLSGQADFIWQELNTTHSSAYSVLKSASGDTIEDAEKCCKLVAKYYVISKGGDAEVSRRVEYTKQFWNLIVTTSSRSVSSGGDSIVRNSSGQTLTRCDEIQIPNSLTQTGIIRNYTYYPYWFDRWARGTGQRRVADAWDKEGRKSSRNIATVGGYYLCATSPKFGSAGDLIKVVLEDNTSFNAVLGDIKGGDAQSPWGHMFGNAVDIIEWESVTSDQGGIDITGWAGKRVAKIYNYGGYV